MSEASATKDLALVKTSIEVRKRDASADEVGVLVERRWHRLDAATPERVALAASFAVALLLAILTWTSVARLVRASPEQGTA